MLLKWYEACVGRFVKGTKSLQYYGEIHRFVKGSKSLFKFGENGEQGSAVVRAFASHQCVPGSIPEAGVICGLSLLLVLFSAPRGFSPGTPVFPSPLKPTFPNSNSIWIIDKHFIMSLWLG